LYQESQDNPSLESFRKLQISITFHVFITKIHFIFAEYLENIVTASKFHVNNVSIFQQNMCHMNFRIARLLAVVFYWSYDIVLNIKCVKLMIFNSCNH